MKFPQLDLILVQLKMVEYIVSININTYSKSRKFSIVWILKIIFMKF